MKIILKKKQKKLGILGGTFDPPHLGHLHISRLALKKLKLDFVMWIITKQNPLKRKTHFNLKTRVKLSKEILKKEKKIFVKNSKKILSYRKTYNLLSYLKKFNKNEKLFFIIGADNLINFHKWNNWKKIPKLAKIIVFARTGYSVKALKSIAAKNLDKNAWSYINAKRINISSSIIRKF